MTIRPCDEFIDCECSDNPFINTSAEAPDPNLFFARRYFPNIPSLNVDDSWYQRAGCLGVCRSDESQQEADDCALRDSQLCTLIVVQPPLTVLSDESTSVPRSNIFGNAAVTCTSPCPDGPPSVFTVPANTFYGLTQQEADALAQSVCEYRALVNRMCSTIPPEPPICDVTITSVMPSSLMQEAEVGDSVAFGVTFDYTGMQNPTFLWLKDGFPLVQTENPSLAISPFIAEDAGFYRLVIIVPNCPPVLSPEIELVELVVECIPDVGPPVPIFPDAPMPDNLGIVDFESFRDMINLCPNCLSLIGDEWTGTFFLASDPTAPVYLGRFDEDPETVGSFKGKMASGGTLRIEIKERADFTLVWQISLSCFVDDDPIDQDLIWVGYKDTGETPVGTYLVDDEFTFCVAQQVKCVTVESI